jgi:catechol 2,3-dioxygenase-like lactoylglutathione lyase family enzyme
MERAPVIIDRIDHLVLTVRDIAATVEFYGRVLGMTETRFGEGRVALMFGSQKINLHEAGAEFEPKAATPTPGAADICLISATPLETVMRHLDAEGVTIEQGPVARSSAQGPIQSLYIRDPDGNLIEISAY